MLDSLKDEPVVQETMQEANEALGFDLNKLIAEGPAGRFKFNRQYAACSF